MVENKTDDIRDLVIVGGGTAGWLMASRLAAKYQTSPDCPVKITLVESPSVKPVGVGEGTWPGMRSTLKAIGLSESDFMRECDASFKQGSKFNGWRSGNMDDSYYHPFTLPLGYDDLDMMHFVQHSPRQGSFAKAVCPQVEICQQGLAPKQITTPEYAGVVNYGYHLNAGKFAALLKRHCLEKFNVSHVLDEVVKVNGAANGDIASVSTENHGDICGDFFIDCTGFACLLLGGFYQVPFIGQRHILFADTALAVQIPYPAADSPIACVTQSTATAAGWIWDIGLTNRRGIGHVYSSDYCSEVQAEQELAAYLGHDFKGVEIKKIPIKPGYRSHAWEKNCLAVGLSAGFLEPLEASAIVQVELAADWLCLQLPANRSGMDVIAKRYNQEFSYRWQRIIDFLKLHYVLSQRRDTDFWLDNRHRDSIPDSLQELLSLWSCHYPTKNEFPRHHEIFSLYSYQYILAGMDYRSEAAYALTALEEDVARQHIMKGEQLKAQYLQHLPGHRELLEKIARYGFKGV
ncbi:tryptophan halogenase family protein [Thalassomonas actiniarum]|uniref:Tryptophan 7-halogenase n=1 Tax=Thalassomonas actiniarum TaxID=485447 RepID=A0AAF0C2A1_9GAMM|nr:tryptophan halogenase family protein [Thalassomonas actiniarum]WDD97554.1 tryptophan 7-halogenase [Thalassomonas actiniarum]